MNQFENLEEKQTTKMQSKMFVIKRPRSDGQERKEEVSFDKVLKRINYIVEDAQLQNVQPFQIAQYVIGNIINNIHTSQLDEFTANYCETMIGQEPEYDTLATRILVSNHQKNCRNNSFRDTMKMLYNNKDIQGNQKPLISKDIMRVIDNEDNWEQIRNAIDYKRDNYFDVFGFKTLYYGYLLKCNGKVVERPQDLYMRVALGIFGKKDLKMALKLYDLISNKVLSLPTPTLYNSGTPNNQFLSCFLAGIDDSIEGMYSALKNLAMISKKSGGIGVHVHNLRPDGAIIHSTGFPTTGVVPFLKVLNDTALHVSQGGKRPGSIAVYMEPHHGDFCDFLDLRKNYGDMQKKCHDLFTAVWISDLFMEYVNQDKDWYLMSEYDCPGLSDAYGDDYKQLYEKYVSEGKYIKVVKAKDLWISLMTSQIESGTPYIGFKDAVNKKSNQQNLGVIRSLNLCAEIAQYSDAKEYACCVLSSIPLGKYVDYDENNNPVYNYEKLGETARFVVRTLNEVIDTNDYPVIETKISNFRHRPLGIGVQGLQDTFFKFKIPFDSPEAAQLNKNIFEQSMTIAKEREYILDNGDKTEIDSITITEYDPIYETNYKGAYSTFNGSPASQGLLQFDLWGQSPPEDSKYNWKQLKEDIKSYGLRNSLLLAIAPTATTSQICGQIEACEPITSNLYIRSVKAGEFTLVNKYMVQHLKELNLWNKDMYNKIIINNGSIQNIEEIPQNVRQIYKTVWDLSQKVIIDQAADRGIYICQTQSMNLFLRQPNFKNLTNMYNYAHQKGLKTGIYYLRTRPKVSQTKFAQDSSAQQGGLQFFQQQSKKTDKQQPTEEEVLACSRANPEACELCSA